ncbi:MAG TPA: protein translocase subunit SecD [Candidatus Babeliales bacterium]|nr:protein translocase subunit SecD [Candidatus Babeliales bacterium]
MNKTIIHVLKAEFIWWIILGVIAAYFIMPLRKNIKFGIDLVGGTYITLEVQAQKAIEDEFNRMAHDVNQRLKKADIEVPLSHTVTPYSLELVFSSEKGAQDAASYFKSSEPLTLQVVTDKKLTVKFSSNQEDQIKKWAVASNVDVLDTRLRKLAVEEITIAQKGDRNIIVELPDVDDPQQAKAMIGKPAVLEFKMVEKAGASQDQLLDEFDGQLPEDMMIVPGRDVGAHGREYYLVSKYADLTGKDLKDARPAFGGDNRNRLVIQFSLNPEGSRKFYELTSNNVGRRLAAILDGSVIVAPNIQETISGGQGSITGNFVGKEAAELASLLKSGSFVAPITFEEERRIGPTLGAESINAGLMACLLGLLFLFVFSIIFYKVGGVLAFIALLYNILLLLFLLSRIKATLTLPGIAGIILTVGMAIDSSILIFEKMKDELAAGASFAQALKLGFSGSLAVILDANITTFIVAVVLFKFGTGPIQGFAVTMMLGIITTLISGLFFLRSLFGFILNVLGFYRIKI